MVFTGLMPYALQKSICNQHDGAMWAMLCNGEGYHAQRGLAAFSALPKAGIDSNHHLVQPTYHTARLRGRDAARTFSQWVQPLVKW